MDKREGNNLNCKMPIRNPTVIHLSVNVNPTTYSESVLTLHTPLNVRGYSVAVFNVDGYLKQWDWRKEALYLCGDFVQDSWLNTVSAPVLTPLPHDFGGTGINSPQTPIWLKTSRDVLTAVRVFLVNGNGEPRSFEQSVLGCSLVFIPQHGQ